MEKDKRCKWVRQTRLLKKRGIDGILPPKKIRAYSSGWYGEGGGAAFNFTRTTEPNWAFRTQTQTQKWKYWNPIPDQWASMRRRWCGIQSARTMAANWGPEGRGRDYRSQHFIPPREFLPDKKCDKTATFRQIGYFCTKSLWEPIISY